MERIERDLMWAYEQVSSGVLARPMAGRDVSGQAADLYSGVDSAARLLTYVSRLPTAQLTAVEAKCGLLPDALNLCARPRIPPENLSARRPAGCVGIDRQTAD